ncbi:MAG: cytochrome c [Litoreibacter sp.]|nr:cytochrome c [Litoreibacter sp.]
MAYGFVRMAGALLLSLGVSTPALAESEVIWAQLGAELYERRCSVCHGTEAIGDGMVGTLFRIKPPNLTTLTRDNGGVFPFLEVFQAVDGHRKIAAHGESEMPIWGDLLMDEAFLREDFNADDARYATLGRLLSLVYFLQSIQQ